MINVKEAKKLIEENCCTLRVETLTLLEANGSILAEPIYAVIDTPPFHQSAMDGYAFSFENWDKKSDLTVIGEIQTGNYSNKIVQSNEVVRIYTGAPIPPGTDTVVMQEKISKDGNTIQILDPFLVKGTNVRPQGSQTQKGEMALQERQLLTPVAISFLAGIGISKVNVFSKPTVSIIVTGKELAAANDEISEGKIFESNSIGLIAALHQLGINPVSVEVVDDVEEEIEKAISNQLSSDILILTGGVSVGDYDLVPDSLEKCGVQKIFHKIKQKPGKPFYFGRHNQTLVFALPGNPAAVMSCFYEYVAQVISSFTQKEYFKKMAFPLADDFNKNAGLTFFLKGKMGEKAVTVLNNQESYKLNSFAVADCLIEFDEEKEIFKKGDLVNVRMIL
ncbi:molybdopterin molybdotransferase MoeA [Flavobacterium franklandianum]|uniref:Molybdopterin molybdenumtransferase n=1 Tax=Flavobacterium franklandianum TaxID=2594430 RepID=A0A553CMA4_9FLAO|nr:molybdopterin molybdotransferase MoeA [Flavobacterium franklandianum]TRX21698.1 molybdopterin molybdotransferase MoeA [Flavobacterium franklandianum]TRX27788.1 molybdopterin molybdotransferase MoeA [Flavobacterium franklandianum]